MFTPAETAIMIEALEMWETHVHKRDVLEMLQGVLNEVKTQIGNTERSPVEISQKRIIEKLEAAQKQKKEQSLLLKAKIIKMRDEQLSRETEELLGVKHE